MIPSENPYSAPQAGSDEAADQPDIEALNRLYRWFAITYWTGYGMVIPAAVIIGVMLVGMRGRGDDVPPALAIGVGLSALVVMGLLLAAFVISMILLYRFWGAVPADGRRTSPGRAVGFLFIPLFNIYWLFVAFVGLARDLNTALAKKSRRDSRQIADGLPIAFCIFNLTGWIPYVGNLVSLANLVVTFLVFKQFKEAVVRLLAQPRSQAIATGPSRQAAW